jgi:hypothetical protein
MQTRIAHQMKGKAIVGENDDEEDEVDKQVEHVSYQLQIKDINPLQTEEMALATNYLSFEILFKKNFYTLFVLVILLLLL